MQEIDVWKRTFLLQHAWNSGRMALRFVLPVPCITVSTCKRQETERPRSGERPECGVQEMLGYMPSLPTNSFFAYNRIGHLFATLLTGSSTGG